MKLNVSLYIPVYNGELTIESVLKSVLKLNPGPEEIIVVNDGSTDRTKEILKDYKDKIHIIDNPSNMGLAHSRNVGVSKSKHENIAALDADVEVDVIVQENFLTIKSSDLPTTEKPKDNVVHKGIAKRAFKRTFTLAEDVVVNDAVLKDGLLRVELERVVPEEKKPKVIKIK